MSFPVIESRRWLLIDSCGAAASVALGVGTDIRAQRQIAGRSFSAEWPAVLRATLAEVGWSASEIDAVGVVHGPGSFTGMRVGVAAAKGLCEASGARVIALSRIDVLEQNAAGCVAVLDAGRGEFYVGDGGRERVATLAEVEGMLEGREVVTAEESVASKLGQGRIVELTAASALKSFLERWEHGLWNDVAAIDANYVRGEREIYGSRPTT